jgi:hypothetical protein
MKVPGDGYLIRNVDAQGFDGFHFVSTSEIDKDSIDQISGVPDRPISWNTLPRDPTGRTARIHREVQPNDWLGRAWLPGRQYVDMADSPLMALKTECEVLHTLTLSIKGRLRSRFALAGILFVPSDITDVVVGTGERKTMDILDYLSKATATNVTRYDEASVALPIYMRGKGEAGEQIKWITIDRELIEQDLQLRSQLIEEILFGLDIQPAATKGDGQQNHWGMWATSDEEIRVAVQPDLDVLAWCLTRLILHPALEDAGWGMERIMKTKVAWDVSESAVRTNKTEDTRQAHDLGLAGGKAVMRVTGLGDEDMMSYEERARWTGRLTKNAYLMLDPPKSPEEIDWDKLEKFAGTAKPGTAPDSPTEPSSVGPGVGDPGSPGGADRDTPKKETPS